MSGNMILRALLVAGTVFALCVPPASATACSVDSFGAKKADVCKDRKCSFFTPPEEIARIERGIYSEFVGLFVNDGLASWLGLDLARREIIEVQRFAGARASRAPAVRASSETHYRRETKTDRGQIIDVVRRAPVAEAQLGEVVCLANKLWVATDPWLPLRVTDMHNELVLVDRDAAKSFGGPGQLHGDAEALRGRVEALKPAW